jgi:hypothetical protein
MAKRGDTKKLTIRCTHGDRRPRRRVFGSSPAPYACTIARQSG